MAATTQVQALYIVNAGYGTNSIIDAGGGATADIIDWNSSVKAINATATVVYQAMAKDGTIAAGSTVVELTG